MLKVYMFGFFRTNHVFLLELLDFEENEPEIVVYTGIQLQKYSTSSHSICLIFLYKSKFQ